MAFAATPAPQGRVGLQQLRANLSACIDEAKSGRTLVITDHGTPVARIAPLAGESTYDRLISEGVIVPARRRTDHLDPPVSVGGPVSDLIYEQRSHHQHTPRPNESLVRG
ncbi:MAG: type II toxin-antitoxin system prevent-host-death family antitoxin [Micrococcales bacterium]|nr:type II toxin-antitoxin system prevent-host-death family antitoxin [Micrococcales bacterium]